MNQRIRNCLLGLALLVPALIMAQLKLVSPNGGESFKVGSRTTITWSGIPATDTVTLDYSTDNGVQWNVITSTATNLQYTWLNIPNTVSANCIVRVSHSTAASGTLLRLVGSKLFQSADFSSDGNFVLGASVDGNCYIWDSHTAQLWNTFQTESGANIPNSFGLNFWGEFSPDGKTFASVSPSTDSNPFGNVVRLFSSTTGAKIKEWNLRSELGGGYTSGTCRFSPDGTMLAVTAKDSVTVLNVATGAVVSLCAGFAISTPTSQSSNVPLCCDWNASSTELMVCAAFKNPQFPTYVRNNALTGDTIQTYWLNTTIPFLALHGAVHFSPDGKRFLGVTKDTTVRVWDAITGQILFQIKSNIREILDAAFSHDGKSIVTVGSDSLGTSGFSVKLWDAANGAAIRDIGKLGIATRTIEFSSDDSRILVSSSGANYIFQNTPGGSESDVSDGVFSITPNTGGNIVVYTTKIAGKANEVVNIPIYIDDPGGAVAAGATQVTTTLEFNVTMLEPIGATPVGTVANGKRTMVLTLPINPLDTLLTTLPMRVALGNDSVTKLDIIGPATNAAIVTATDRDGAFTLLDLCTQGGARLVNPDGIASIILMAPNPARTSMIVAVNLIEDGITSLIITDETGKIAKTIFNNVASYGKRIVQLSVDDLPSGRYFLSLQTPTFRTTMPLEIAR